MNDEMKLVDGWWEFDQRQKRDEMKEKMGTEIALLMLFTSKSFFSFHFIVCKKKTRFLPTWYSFIHLAIMIELIFFFFFINKSAIVDNSLTPFLVKINMIMGNSRQFK